MSADRKILTIHPPLSVSTLTSVLGVLNAEFPAAYFKTEDFTVWTGEDEGQPTDWPSFAGDLISGDPERLRKHMPQWLRDIVDETAEAGPDAG